MNDYLVAVDAPHFYAGIVMDGDRCVKAAPILAWAIGKTRAELSGYFRKHRWKAIVIYDVRRSTDNRS